METEENVLSLAENKILLGLDLINKLDQFKKLPGVQKIQRKIGQEIKFLNKVKKSNTLVINHVMCSNLTHYEFLVQILLKQKNVIHVDCPFLVDNRPNPIHVDIVCENGAKWIKVIARNSKSISDAVKGGVSFGVKSIVDQAEEYSRTAEQNLYMFKKPKVLFCFSHNIEKELLEKIHIHGITTSTANDEESVNTLEANIVNDNFDKMLNLDITTMLAYVSSLTNGQCNWIFREPLLTDQAIKERKTPLKPILDNLFEGKKLVCCQSAMDSFKSIVNILAGPAEKERAKALINRVEVNPDLVQIPEELRSLQICGKIKPRSLQIFAFGFFNKIITVTSNEGFIRSVKMKGIIIPVFIHQARALTESKQNDATLIDITN
ncbi:UPF0415 protein C7orf25 homolog [Condylostylus longicornis]|uniref:UPF0415 protein C7orf25 homolog n=1 Tax=Condylostylus longicornis TaxID=2530218 RepID=UPI00244DFE79|nr:UPF0415 protein C7orf25 homolog [Condylostylus longicornis]